MKKTLSNINLDHFASKDGIQVSVSDSYIKANGSFEVIHTYHSFTRSKKRGINDGLLANILTFGTCYEKQGLQFYVLSNKEIKDNNLQIELNGSLVAILKDNILITTYYTRSKSGHRYIHKKDKEYSIRN